MLLSEIMVENPQQTEWYVVTGSLSCGKTSLINWLAFHNYQVVPESARLIIDEGISQGKTIQEIRADEKAFQEKVLKSKVEAENRVPVGQITFWDRGIPDTLAYWQLITGQQSSDMSSIPTNRKYRGVFLLDRLPVHPDYARTEDETFATKLHDCLRETYQSLGYTVITIPVMPVSERGRFILDHIKISD